MRRGTFIAIEGVDKLANTAQLEMLAERLQKDGQEVLCLDFAELHEPAGHFVKQYLEGKYGSQNDVGPYTSSLFFAMNRYHAAEEIRQALDEGKVVLVTDFTGSSMAQQGCTFTNPEERRGFYIWLDNLEYQMLRLPRPDKSFILRMPVDSLSGHFKRLASTYDDLPQLFPKDFTRVDYVRSGKSMDTKQLHDYIWKFAEPLLPKLKLSKQIQNNTIQPSSVYIPEELSDATRQTYTDILGQILELRRQIGDALFTNNNLTRVNQKEILESLLPVAAYTSPAEQQQAMELVNAPDMPELKLRKNKNTYAESLKALNLHTILPRNELDILSDVLYPAGSLSLNQLKEQLSSCKYDQKAKLLEDTLHSGDKAAILKHFSYGFELLVSIYSLRAIESVKEAEISAQAFSPRYGFEVADFLEEQQLEQYEKAFELSLKLYSALQEAGFQNIAQLAVLRGHKVQINLRTNGAVFIRLIKVLNNKDQQSTTKKLAKLLVDSVEQVHPLASQYYTKELV